MARLRFHCSNCGKETKAVTINGLGECCWREALNIRFRRGSPVHPSQQPQLQDGTTDTGKGIDSAFSQEVKSEDVRVVSGPDVPK